MNIRPIGQHDGLDEEYERKKEIKDNSRFFVLSNLNKGVILNLDGKNNM